jgi:hypothetical protein
LSLIYIPDDQLTPSALLERKHNRVMLGCGLSSGCTFKLRVDQLEHIIELAIDEGRGQSLSDENICRLFHAVGVIVREEDV